MTMNAKNRTITHASGTVEHFDSLAAMMAAWSKYQNEARALQPSNVKQARRDEKQQAGVR